MMLELPVQRQPMLPVNFIHTVGFRYLPSYLYNFMRVAASRVEIDTINLKDYLNRPDDLLHDLQGAYLETEKMRSGSKNVRGHDHPYDYWFMTGYKYPLTNGRWHKASASEDYLTVMSRDYTTERWDYVGHTVYIKLDVHERILQETKSDISRLIGDKIEKGIASAIRKNTATVEEIQNERERLEQQIAALDIAEQKAIEREAKKAAKQHQQQPRSRAGFVYVVKQVGGDHYKIGRTVDPDDRLTTFNVKLPFPVEFEILIKCEDMYKLESDLHYQYASKRIRGEWFQLDANDLEAIRGLQ
jgi:hypothetical protein